MAISAALPKLAKGSRRSQLRPLPSLTGRCCGSVGPGSRGDGGREQQGIRGGSPAHGLPGSRPPPARTRLQTGSRLGSWPPPANRSHREDGGCRCLDPRTDPAPYVTFPRRPHAPNRLPACPFAIAPPTCRIPHLTHIRRRFTRQTSRRTVGDPLPRPSPSCCAVPCCGLARKDLAPLPQLQLPPLLYTAKHHRLPCWHHTEPTSLPPTSLPTTASQLRCPTSATCLTRLPTAIAIGFNTAIVDHRFPHLPDTGHGDQIGASDGRTVAWSARWRRPISEARLHRYLQTLRDLPPRPIMRRKLSPLLPCRHNSRLRGYRPSAQASKGQRCQRTCDSRSPSFKMRSRTPSTTPPP